MAMATEAVKPIGTSLAEIIRASGRSPREQAGQTTVLTKRRKKRQKYLAMQEPSTEVIRRRAYERLLCGTKRLCYAAREAV